MPNKKHCEKCGCFSSSNGHVCPSHPRLGKKWTPEQRIKLIRSHLGQHSSPKTEFKKGTHPSIKTEFKKGHVNSKEVRKKMSMARKGKPHSEEWKRNILKAMFDSPTTWEQKIIDLCVEYQLPFKFTGRGDFFIGRFNPDFIETNGRKLAIEVYAKRFKEQLYEVERTNKFAEFGYSVLFLNDDDILRDDWKEHCLNRIKSFDRGGLP